MASRKDIKIKNVSDNRIRELKYFCLQYLEWKREIAYNRINIKSVELTDMPKSSNTIGNATQRTAIRNIELINKCELIEQSAIEADSGIYQYIIKNVTERIGYNYLIIDGISVPCCKDYFYKKRRKFFEILNNKKI